MTTYYVTIPSAAAFSVFLFHYGPRLHRLAYINVMNFGSSM